MSVEELAEMHRQLDKYLTNGWIKLSVSPYGALILFCLQKGRDALHMYQFQDSEQINKNLFISNYLYW